MVDIILSASFGILFDDVLSLSFGADKQNLTALSGNVARGRPEPYTASDRFSAGR